VAEEMISTIPAKTLVVCLVIDNFFITIVYLKDSKKLALSEQEIFFGAWSFCQLDSLST